MRKSFTRCMWHHTQSIPNNNKTILSVNNHLCLLSLPSRPEVVEKESDLIIHPPQAVKGTSKLAAAKESERTCDTQLYERQLRSKLACDTQLYERQLRSKLACDTQLYERQLRSICPCQIPQKIKDLGCALSSTPSSILLSDLCTEHIRSLRKALLRYQRLLEYQR
jgi:hypothetical protein